MASFIDFDFKLPSKEEIEAKRQSAYDWTRRNLIDPAEISLRTPDDQPTRMNLLSLPAWLAVAQRAWINKIPAWPLASLDARIYYDVFDDPNGPSKDQYDHFQYLIKHFLKRNQMVRMEQVAPREIKALMSEGQPMSSGLYELADDGGLYLDLHEDRFYTTFGDLGDDKVRAFSRPILKPRLIEGEFRDKAGSWPAEFRVFVESGRIVGISNYYPQVAMDPERFAAPMREVRDAAQAILDTMAELHLGVGNHALCSDRNPGGVMEDTPDWMSHTWGRQDFTLDFILSESNTIFFLEGGPAGMTSAHPCCFLQDGREIEPDFLHGVAWSDHTPITALDALG
jgi:hypothetical protein